MKSGSETQSQNPGDSKSKGALQVRLEALKRCAKLLKRAADLPHSRALEVLAVSFGWKSYYALLHGAGPVSYVGDMAPGAAALYFQDWCARVLAEIQLEELHCPIDLAIWFNRMTAGSAAPVQRGCEAVVPRHVHDPMLEACNWRDAEFRQWIGQIVDRGKPNERDCDDLCDTAERESINRLEEFA